MIASAPRASPRDLNMGLNACLRMALGICLAVAPWAVGADTSGALMSAEQGTERLGTVSFPVSCSPSVQPAFNRGVALLHDFWYAEARPQFERILKADPSCAMAHWGIAMSVFHQIWNRPDDAAMTTGQHELQAARKQPPKTAREREYIAALSVFFKPGKEDYQSRIEAYAAAMGELAKKHPDDVDAGAFYALALLAAKKADDPSLDLPRKALAVLVPLWKKYPDHPGLVHYIIHASDSPELATEGLAAARHYGEIAASGAHAVHMPGHIFAQLGLWQEDIAANRASVAACKAAEARHENGWMDQFHADDFLLYAYLQSGQDEQARTVVAEAMAAMDHYESMGNMTEEHGFMAWMFPRYRTRFPLFVALESRDWKGAAVLEPVKGASPSTQTDTYWGRTIADWHLRDATHARADAARYDTLMEEAKKADAEAGNSASNRIQRGEVRGWVAFAEGNTVEAVKQLRAAADLQDQVGQGEVDIPAREMLADVLLESSQPQQALVEYQQDLKRNPNRFYGLFNAGRAAEMANQPVVAREYYAALLKSTHDGAHSPRPELAHARAFVNGLQFP